MITISATLKFVNSEEYIKFLKELEEYSEVEINVDSTVYGKVLANDLKQINKTDIRISDFKDILKEKEFLYFCMERIKIDNSNYSEHVEKEMEKIREVIEKSREISGEAGINGLYKFSNLKNIYKKYFLFNWMTDYYFLCRGDKEFFCSLEERDIPLIEDYEIRIPKLFKEIKKANKDTVRIIIK